MNPEIPKYPPRPLRIVPYTPPKVGYRPPNYHICPPDESVPLAGVIIPFPEHMVFGNAKDLMLKFLTTNVHKFRSLYDDKHSKEDIACWNCITNDNITPRMQFTICLYMRNGRPTAYLDNSIFTKNYELWPLILDTLETYVAYDTDPVIRDAQDIADIYFS